MNSTCLQGCSGCLSPDREKLLLGEQKALLVLDRAGHASLAVEGEQIPPEA